MSVSNPPNNQPQAELRATLTGIISKLIAPTDEDYNLGLLPDEDGYSPDLERAYYQRLKNIEQTVESVMALFSASLKELEGMIPEKCQRYGPSNENGGYPLEEYENGAYNQAIDQTHQAFTTYREKEGL